jgi:hypothetical protein
MRRSDIAGPRLLNKEVKCYNCQKVSKPEIVKMTGTKPGEKYTGNLDVKREIPVVDIENKNVLSVFKESLKKVGK